MGFMFRDVTSGPEYGGKLESENESEREAGKKIRHHYEFDYESRSNLKNEDIKNKTQRTRT